MMKINFKMSWLAICLASTIIVSCKDEDGNPTIEKPVLVVTPIDNNVGAGDIFKFSVDASGLNKLTKLTVEQTYNNNKRIILDSAFNPAKTGVTFAYNYRVPDSAIKGQTITLVFSLTDEKGNVTTDTETFTIANSKPVVKVDMDKVSASAGDTVNTTVTITTPVANLKNIEVLESKNGTLGTPVKTENFPDNTGNTTYTYSYVVPADLQVGQYVVLVFRVANNDNVSASATKRIDIK